MKTRWYLLIFLAILLLRTIESPSPFWIVSCIIATIIIGIELRKDITRERKLMQSAKERYELSLMQLKRSPENNESIIEMLEAGQEYAKLMRLKYPHPPFTDAMITNDLEWIKRASNLKASNVVRTRLSEPTQTIRQRLSALETSFAEDRITQADYKKRRKEILGSA